MPLYKVNVEIQMDMLVDAKDPSEAEQIARDNVREEMSNSDPTPWVSLPVEIKSTEEIPSDWAGCMPYTNKYNLPGNYSCEAVLEWEALKDK